jgi:hypothetical protein
VQLVRFGILGDDVVKHHTWSEIKGRIKLSDVAAETRRRVLSARRTARQWERPVAGFGILMPLALKLFASPNAQAWVYGHHIDWSDS